MKRLILLTFGFLGWAFYEMSGGDEFESASDRITRLNPAPEVTVEPVVEPVTEQVAQIVEPVVDTDPPAQTEVTRVALNLTTLQNVTEEAEATETVANVDSETGVAVNADATRTSAVTPAIIPSLITPNDTGDVVIATAEPETPPAGDIRTVSGNRVNVRGGPSTDFGVVTRLVRGDAVEILEDNGNGWVLMRPVDGGTQGWMADFLLTSG